MNAKSWRTRICKRNLETKAGWWRELQVRTVNEEQKKKKKKDTTMNAFCSLVSFKLTRNKATATKTIKK